MKNLQQHKSKSFSPNITDCLRKNEKGRCLLSIRILTNDKMSLQDLTFI